LSFRTAYIVCFAALLTVMLTFVACLGMSYVADGATGPLDPEGVAYLTLFTSAAIPGLIVGLLASHFVYLRMCNASAVVGTLGTLAAAVATSLAAYPLIWALLGLWQFFHPLTLIVPGVAGLIGGAILVALELKPIAAPSA
jgi:hypothetical protein